ncbi:putative ATP-dependent RNA helicase DDX43 [Oratosquilla oratoria]|uniref:putative ATP-dependent RNA helicase DDX43 n=1 Tax=Oratosquilla oratoria TaxID=337810 RepID=UPI003F75CB55
MADIWDEEEIPSFPRFDYSNLQKQNHRVSDSNRPRDYSSSNGQGWNRGGRQNSNSHDMNRKGPQGYRGGRSDNDSQGWSTRGTRNSADQSWKNGRSQFDRRSNTAFENRSDNWFCGSCNFSNFASRWECFKCKTPKPNDTVEKEDKYKEPDTFEPIDWKAALKADAEAEKERLKSLPPIIKDMYLEDDEVAAMTPIQVTEFRKKCFNMRVYNLDKEDKNPIPNPVAHFDQAFRHFPEVLEVIEKQEFVTPSPIQSQAWPILMKGLDMIGIAQTGTGKTLAFILPALLHIEVQPVPRKERCGPTCLIVAPTRELAQQIEKEVEKYCYRGIKCVCVYGQGDRRKQIEAIKNGAEIVVATPGRLNDFTNNSIVDLSSVSYLVLDEADRMLDMGFEHQIRKFVLRIRPDRQTVMTSATWPEGVRFLATKLMNNPIHVIVGSLDLKAVHTVSQEVHICSEDEKLSYLEDFIKNMKGDDKAIVFAGRKAMVDYVSVMLIEKGYDIQSMHGDRDQEDREQALSDLASGAVKILIATDVASRGIDIQDITHVFNYDCPRDMEEYVHRVGRTGRAGRTGKAITLMTRENWRNAQKLIDILEKTQETVPKGLRDMAQRWKKAQEEDSGKGRRNLSSVNQRSLGSYGTGGFW